MNLLKQHHHAFCITQLRKKEILAYILKEDLDAFKDCSFEEIMACIEDEIKFNISCPTSKSLEKVEHDYPAFLQLVNDVFFTINIPNSDEKIDIAINIDTEKDESLFHDRAENYVHDVLIHYLQHRLDHPDLKIRKFISIWISLYPSSDVPSSMLSYRINLGTAHEDENHIRLEKSKLDTDFFNFDRICLKEPQISRHSLFQVLHILFDPCAKSGYERLAKEYGFIFDSDERIEVENEEELQALLEIGDELCQGIKETLIMIQLNCILHVRKKLGLSLDEAMDACGITQEERENLLPYLNKKTSA